MADSSAPADHYDHFLFSVVHHFTNLEVISRRLLQIKSGLRPDYFDAILGLPPLNSAATSLTKLYKLDPHPEYQEVILSTLEQLKTISRLRNWMVHAGGYQLATGEYLVRLNPNERSVVTGAAHHLFSYDDFLRAIHDLSTISALLVLALGAELPYANYLQDNLPWKFKLPGIERA